MRKPLAYYHDRGQTAALLIRLNETKDADIVTRSADNFVAQEDEADRRAAELAFDEAFQAECTRIDAARAASVGVEHPDASKPVRSLLCACCAGRALGRQYHNQDTGYGLCADCVGYVATRTDEFERCYGVKGVHFAIPDQPPA